jgi:hypothetical protein
MKNPLLDLYLSSASRAAGWWMGHAANAVRRGQAARLAEAGKGAARAAAPTRKPRRRPKAR